MSDPDKEFLAEIGLTAEEFKQLKRRQRRGAVVGIIVSSITLYVGLVMLHPISPLMGKTVGVIALIVFLQCLGVLFGWS